METEIEDPDDVRVIEFAGDLGLAEKALPDLPIGRGAGLERNVPLDNRVIAFVNDPKTPVADLLDDLVFSELFPRLGGKNPSLGVVSRAGVAPSPQSSPPGERKYISSPAGGGRLGWGQSLSRKSQ